MLRALHDHVHLTEQMQRHREANRPSLPDEVIEALEFPDPNERDFEAFDISAEDLTSQQLFDAPAVKPPAGSDESERPINELFE